MRKRSIIAVLFCLLAPLFGLGQGPRKTDWQGKVEIHKYNFLYGTGQRYVYGHGGNFVGTKPIVTRHVETATRDYDLYVGAGGTVREQLTHATGQPSIGPPKDVRLLHYGVGWGLVFDRGKSTAVRGPLTPPTSPREIGTRTILGFLCEGKQYKWRTRQGGTVDLQTWRATRSGIGVPLLQITHFSDKTGTLLALVVQFVALIKPVSSLPESLFQQPTGLRVTHVPFIE